LISVMVALVLLAGGVLALSATLTNAAAANSSAGFRTVGLDIARQRMEWLRSIPPQDVSVNAEPGGTAVNAEGRPDNAGKFRRRVVVSDVRANLISVLVEVTYPGGAEPVQLLTYIYTGGVT
jgi:Tfp pilus assembly protein PilV